MYKISIYKKFDSVEYYIYDEFCNICASGIAPDENSAKIYADYLINFSLRKR